MKVVSICSQKGGVGKTTLALNLGVMSEQRGLRTVLHRAKRSVTNPYEELLIGDLTTPLIFTGPHLA